MLTKKDYEKLVEILKGQVLGDIKPEYREKVIDGFCRWLKEDNPRFDEERFREALGDE
jgi:hypothetical protein